MFKPPKELSFTGNVAENWSTWKQQFTIFLRASGRDSAGEEKVKVAYFLNLIGEEGLKVFNSLKIDSETVKLSELEEKFEQYCKPRANIVYERFCFRNLAQKEGQSFDSYLTELKNAASKCSYGDQEESMVRDQIIYGVKDSDAKQNLLRIEDVDLKKAAEYCRAVEASKSQIKNLQGETAVDAVQWQKTKTRNKKIEDCRYCGYSHLIRECPAFNKECSLCGQRGHFAKMCRKTGKTKKKVYEVQEEEEDSSNEDDGDPNHNNAMELFVHEVKKLANSEEEAWYEDIRVNGIEIRFKLDSGAEVSCLPLSIYKSFKNGPVMKPTKSVIVSYGNNCKLKPKGMVSLSCCNKNENVRIDFLVIDVNSDPILGLKDCLKLGLIKRVDLFKKGINTREELINSYSHVFTGTGNFPGLHHITVKSDAVPVVNPPRRVPLALTGKLKQSITHLEQQGIVSRVDRPTNWVHNLVIAEKTNGELRLCLDPKDLNLAVKRELYLIPKPEDIIANLAGMSIFSVFDMKEGFWQIKLDNESADLCTFNTPFGRYRFNRLPFGICSAPEVFQKKNMELFGDLKGIFIYFDDIIVCGSNEVEHDQNLDRLLERAAKYDVKFNKNKVQYKSDQVKYCGYIISKDSIRIDPKFVRAITETEYPNDKKALQRYLGFVKYLTKFIPNLSQITAPLRELIKEGVIFKFDQSHKNVIDILKTIISSEPVLKIFDSNQPIVIQTDASQNGLGACLLQNNQPVAFVSRSMSDCEKRYAQIEKEMLAIQFACSKFHYYIYGRNVTVHTDHRPLESIFKKSVNQLSARLQNIRLKTMKYSLNVTYLKGSLLYVADYLSRAFLDEVEADTAEEEVIVHVIAKYIPVSQERKLEFQKETQRDVTLNKVFQYVTTEWPNKKLSHELEKYRKLGHELSTGENLLFLNERLIVPSTMRVRMLKLLHENHFGIAKTKARARLVFYWPGMARSIEDMINKCKICEKYSRKNVREPLKQPEIPSRPWERISSDILYYEGNEYLVVIDSYSKWIELKQLKTKSAAEVIEILKEIFSRQGIPDTLMSDNVPFGSTEILNFANSWGFKTLTSSPTYPQSNGLAEKGVSIAKSILKKGENMYLGLLEYRNSPIVSIGLSPSQLLNSRRLKDKLPVSVTLLATRENDKDKIHKALKKNQQQQEYYYNRKGSKPQQGLEKGDDIIIRKDKVWVPGTVIAKHTTPRSYVVQDSSGSIKRRNRKELKKSENAFEREPQGDLEGRSDESGQDSAEDISAHSQRPTSGENSEVIDNQSSDTNYTPVRPKRNVQKPVRFNDYASY